MITAVLSLLTTLFTNTYGPPSGVDRKGEPRAGIIEVFLTMVYHEITRYPLNKVQIGLD